MIVKKLVVGPLEENVYIVGDEVSKETIIIDPGDEPDRIIEIIESGELKILNIICTHGHFDHVGAVMDIRKATGAKVLMHRGDDETYRMARDQAAFWGYTVDDLPEPDGFLKEGDEVRTGSHVFRVLHTPGHSPGCICLHGEGILFAGDTIFRGSVGRTDLPGGSHEKLKESFRRLMQLPEDTIVYSGHGPETTIRSERRDNFFLSEL
jgi:glyoxylase-like metal-dependent hydrolase (beta-lactamase superfamily II)